MDRSDLPDSETDDRGFELQSYIGYLDNYNYETVRVNGDITSQYYAPADNYFRDLAQFESSPWFESTPSNQDHTLNQYRIQNPTYLAPTNFPSTETSDDTVWTSNTEYATFIKTGNSSEHYGQLT